MTKFRTEMEKCVGLTKEIEGEFDKLIHCARELNRAMANEMSMLLGVPPRFYTSPDPLRSQRSRLGRVQYPKSEGRRGNTEADTTTLPEPCQ